MMLLVSALKLVHYALVDLDESNENADANSKKDACAVAINQINFNQISSLLKRDIGIYKMFPFFQDVNFQPRWLGPT